MSGSAGSRYAAATALVVVDVQNDFADPAGGLSVIGGAEIVAAINTEIAQARRDGSFVVYTQDWHPVDTPHFEKDGGLWPVHCVAETWGAAFHPALIIEGPAVRKGRDGENGYSGFTMRDPRSGDEHATGLAGLLAEHEIRRLVVVGLATDYCVKETVLDAIQLGFDTTVLADAIHPVNRAADDGQRALDAMRSAGATIA